MRLYAYACVVRFKSLTLRIQQSCSCSAASFHCDLVDWVCISNFSSAKRLRNVYTDITLIASLLHHLHLLTSYWHGMASVIFLMQKQLCNFATLQLCTVPIAAYSLLINGVFYSF